MKTPRIEEIAGEVWRLIKDEWEEKDGKLPSGWTGIGSAYGSYSRLIEALTQAHQAGIDEAVDICWRYCGTDATNNLEDAIKQERERIKALQDNK